MGNKCCEPPVDTEKFQQYCEKEVGDNYKQFFNTFKQQLNEQANQKSDYTSDFIIGKWQNQKNQKTGNGIIFSPNKFYYEGDIVNAEANGNGKIIWPSHSTFIGNFYGNKASGFGTLRLTDERIELKGNWNDGLPAINSPFEMLKNEQQMQITFLQNINPKYIQLNGNSNILQRMSVQIKFADNSVYIGQLKFKNKSYKIEGNGTLTFSNGSSYKGGFVDGKMHGIGKFVWGDTKHWYEGEYKQNFRDGSGIYYYSYDNFKEGTWVSGHYKGQKVQADIQKQA